MNELRGTIVTVFRVCVSAHFAHIRVHFRNAHSRLSGDRKLFCSRFAARLQLCHKLPAANRTRRVLLQQVSEERGRGGFARGGAGGRDFRVFEGVEADATERIAEKVIVKMDGTSSSRNRR